MLTSASAAPFINEFHAENIGQLMNSAGSVVPSTGAYDVNGNAPDWIEIRNPDGVAVNLQGWALSNDAANLGKWVFPSVSVGAGAHLQVFASGKDRAVSGVQLHTNFKLSNSGAIYLSQPNGGGGWTLVHQIGSAATPYPAQNPRFSYGYAGTTGPAGSLGYFEQPTPGSANLGLASQVTTFVGDTSFSVDRGLYDSAQSVTITCPTLGATIIYTTDGSEPTLATGTQVPAANGSTAPSANVSIPGTTCLRARAVKTGMGATDVDTQTYIFPTQVLSQSGPPQASINWGVPGPDWEMDPDVVNHADPNSKCVADDLKTLPTISVVLNWGDLFGSSTAAIYPPASGVAVASVERRASFEILNPDGSKLTPNAKGGKQQSGTVEVTGGTSPNRTTSAWPTHKLSLKFNFGPDLDFNVFGDNATSRFDQLILDGRYNNVWTYGGGSSPEAQRLRSDLYGDAFLADLQLATGGCGPHSRAVHLYLNGLYWGVYVMHERPDQNFTSEYLGGDGDEWDIVKHQLHGNGDPTQGAVTDSLVAGKIIDPAQALSLTNHTAGVNYQALLNLANADLSVQANYNAVLAKLDIVPFIEYLLINFYFGNTDWAHQNWYASYNRVQPGGKWHYHSWDAEHIMESLTTNSTGLNNLEGPTHIHQQLKNNPEYRLLFADVVHRRMFNGGLLTYPRVWNEFDARMQVFSEAMRAESARWGDNRAYLRPSPFTDVPYLRGVEWFNQRTWWQNTYFPARSNNSGTTGTGSVFAQLKAQNVYPATAAPVFSQHGGSVVANYNLTMTNPGGAGVIYFTTDGSDPRVEITGAVRGTATQYTVAVSLPSSRTVKARVLNAGAWSALNEAYFSVGAVAAAPGNLVISKIHYRPGAPSGDEITAGYTDRSDFEFVEILNISGNAVNLDGISFSAGLDITLLPGGTRELAPGGRALFVANKAAFEFRYGPGLPIAGTFTLGSSLSNDGETLSLVAANAATIISVNYSDTGSWPTGPNGNGPALVLSYPGTSNPALGSSWRQSSSANGSPGVDDRITFAAWKTTHFPGGGPNADALADPDADGFVNMVECGLGTDPKIPNPLTDGPTASTVVLDVGIGPKPYLIFTVRKLRAAEELAWTAEGADVFGNWSSGASVIVPIGAAVDNGDGTDTRTYRAAKPVDAGGAQYFRSRVTGP